LTDPPTEENALHVLFVCTGNVCRSPTAERLATKYVEQQGFQGFHASSAGTRAMIGYPMQPVAAEVLRTLGGDPADFVARQITPKIAAGADLVLTMTRSHRDHVLELVPHKLRRVYTVAEAGRLVSECGAKTIEDFSELRSQLPARSPLDIADPMGRDEAFFEAVGAQIAEILPPILDVCIRGKSSSPA
jgi:protein-tyrosine phosphatase